MEQNIADLLKDAFSEVDIDFEHQFEEGTNTSQIVMDEEIDLKDASKLWATSDLGLVETNFSKQEENEDGTDSSEESASSNLPPIETGCALCPSQGMDHDQCAEKTTTEAQRVDQASDECAVEDESSQSDEEIDVSMHGLVADVRMLEDEQDLSQDEELTLGSVEDQATSGVEYQQSVVQTSSRSVPNDELEERSSGSDEEGPTQCDTNGNMEEPFIAVKPNMSAGSRVGDDLREFTEEDQEQIEESLADYPSDLSQSEAEECAESAGDQLSTLLDSSLSDDHLNKMIDMSHAEEDNLQEEDQQMDFTFADNDTEIKEPEVQTIPDTADVDASFQRENVEENDTEESVSTDSSTEEDTRNQRMGDARDVSNGNNQGQADYDSDISSDHSSSEEEISEGSVRPEEEWESGRQHNVFIENLGRADVDRYIEIDTDDRDGSNPDMDRDFTNASLSSNTNYPYDEPNEQSTELCPTFESVQLDAAIKVRDVPLTESLDNVRDTNTLISEVFWSSDVLMGEDKLLLDEYDWDLSGGHQLESNLGEENQEDPEEALEELDIDENEEGTERDWEQEKPRIEAFYRFYNQDEMEDKADRNHRVTFRLDHESSECDEDSESSEQELDKDPDTPLTTVKPEYDSESDDELQEKPLIHEKPKLWPKEQQPVSSTQNASPKKNKCLAVLKSVLTLGLLTAIGMVSFWWATDTLDWIH